VKSVMPSREEGKTSAAGAVSTGGGFEVAAAAGTVEANRMPAAFRINGTGLENGLLAYMLEDEAPVLERGALDRTVPFWTTEEHCRNQQTNGILED
jgi:hypothetical protein